MSQARQLAWNELLAPKDWRTWEKYSSYRNLVCAHPIVMLDLVKENIFCLSIFENA